MSKSSGTENTPSSKRVTAAKPAAGQTISWVNRLGGITSGAYKFAKRTGSGSYRVGRSILNSQDQLKLMAGAGQSLKDLREVAGLTITEISDAVNLKDRSFWEAVEDGTATLSFELILRLSALLARNDPIPFILKYTRTYNPEIWRLLNDWGLGRLPLQYERERQFINIYRSHDSARTLSDDGFQTVLGFTRKAFEMSLHFTEESEQLTSENERLRNENQTLNRALAKAHKSGNKRRSDVARDNDAEAALYRDSKPASRDKSASKDTGGDENDPNEDLIDAIKSAAEKKDSRTASNNRETRRDK